MKIKAMILFFLSFLLPFVGTFAADPASGEKELTVAVAANVQYPFEELKSVFEKETGIMIKPAIGSSGRFTAQIENGAPFDVFLSADMEYPQTLKKEGLTTNAPRIYAYGTLVIWTMNDLELWKGMKVLGEAKVKKIAIASPQTAPYGRQAVNALKYYNLYSQVNQKLVYGESIAQTNQFISTKAADAGITAKSVVLAPGMKDQGRWVDVDKNAYEPIAQGAVILKQAEEGHLDEAKKFFDFLFSNQAGEIFKKYGYVLPRL